MRQIIMTGLDAGVPLLEDLERGDSIAWLRTANQYSFTPMFCVKGMVHWIASDYHRRHPDAEEAHLEGFGRLDLPSEGLSGTFLLQCIQFDASVDEGIRKSHSAPKKLQKKRKSASQAPSQASEEEEDEAEEDPEPIQLKLPPEGWTIDEVRGPLARRGPSPDGCPQERGITGFPETEMCVLIALRILVSGPVTRQAFCGMIHMLPTSISIRILQSRLNVQVRRALAPRAGGRSRPFAGPRPLAAPPHRQPRLGGAQLAPHRAQAHPRALPLQQRRRQMGQVMRGPRALRRVLTVGRQGLHERHPRLPERPGALSFCVFDLMLEAEPQRRSPRSWRSSKTGSR